MRWTMASNSRSTPLTGGWVSRVALFAVLVACGGSTQDGALGSREGFLVDDGATIDALAAPVDLTAGNAAEESGTSNSASQCQSDDDSDGDDSEADEANEESGGDDVEMSAGVDQDDQDEDDQDEDDQDEDDQDEDDQDEDDQDEDDQDEDDSDGDDCVPAEPAPTPE